MFSFRVSFISFYNTLNPGHLVSSPSITLCGPFFSIKSVASGFTLNFHHPTKEKTGVGLVGITNGTKPCRF
jgi:hypothetical protein